MTKQEQIENLRIDLQDRMEAIEIDAKYAEKMMIQMKKDLARIEELNEQLEKLTNE
jgi:hypothetical protein